MHNITTLTYQERMTRRVENGIPRIIELGNQEFRLGRKWINFADVQAAYYGRG